MTNNNKTEGANLKFPSYTIMGKSLMHDGKEVLIMSPEQWNTYCFNYNKINSLPQPP